MKIALVVTLLALIGCSEVPTMPITTNFTRVAVAPTWPHAYAVPAGLTPVIEKVATYRAPGEIGSPDNWGDQDLSTLAGSGQVDPGSGTTWLMAVGYQQEPDSPLSTLPPIDHIVLHHLMCQRETFVGYTAVQPTDLDFRLHGKTFGTTLPASGLDWGFIYPAVASTKLLPVKADAGDLVYEDIYSEPIYERPAGDQQTPYAENDPETSRVAWAWEDILNINFGFRFSYDVQANEQTYILTREAFIDVYAVVGYTNAAGKFVPLAPGQTSFARGATPRTSVSAAAVPPSTPAPTSSPAGTFTRKTIVTPFTKVPFGS